MVLIHSPGYKILKAIYFRTAEAATETDWEAANSAPAEDGADDIKAVEDTNTIDVFKKTDFLELSTHMDEFESMQIANSGINNYKAGS